MADYTYRGTYDENETGRINDLLAQQRELLNNQQKETYNWKYYLIKYGLLVAGVTAIVLTVKYFKNKP